MSNSIGESPRPSCRRWCLTKPGGRPHTQTSMRGPVWRETMELALDADEDVASDCVRDDCSYRHPATNCVELVPRRETRDVSRSRFDAEERCSGRGASAWLDGFGVRALGPR